MVYEYVVWGDRAVSEYVVPARTVAICVPPLYIRYPATAILSVEALHERLIWDAETAVAVRPVGTVGACVSETILLTVTDMPPETVVFPAASRAVAVRV